MSGKKNSHAARVAGKNGFSLISDEKFRQMYAALLRCSLLDAQLRTCAGYASPGYTPWTGCRAGTAGVVTCLREGDSVTPTPRGALAGYLHHGRLDLLAGDPAAGPASHLTLAMGDALRHRLEKRGGIAVVFTAVANPAVMRIVFTAAAKQSLPILYVLDGDTPSPEVCANIPVIRVDAADTVAVYRVAYESILRSRDGGGATILACAPWPGEEAADPLAKLEHYLAAKKLFRRDWKQRLEIKYGRAVAEAVAQYVENDSSGESRDGHEIQRNCASTSPL